MQGLVLESLPLALGVYRFSAGAKLSSDFVNASGFLAITRTDEELSVVCERSAMTLTPERSEEGWRAFKVRGPLDFGLTGILSAIAKPLAEAGVSIFAISTFDTDYVLVKDENHARAGEILAAHFTLQ